jgi:O-antigen ligase
MLLALAGVPLSFAGRQFLQSEAGERFVADKNMPARARTPLLVITTAAVAVLLTRVPVLGAALVGALFLVVLAADRLAAWLLLIIALPWAWDYVNERAAFVVQFPTEPGIILLVAAWVYSLLLRGGAPIPRGRLLLAITVFVGCIPLSMITTWNVRDSLFHLVSTTGLVLGGAIIPMFEIRDVARIRIVLLVFLVNGVLVSLVGIAQVATSPLSFDRAAFFIGEPFLYNHGPFAAYLGFPFAVATVWLLHRRLTLSSLPLLAAGTVMAVAIFLSLTRAEWVAVAALFAVIAAVQFRRTLRTLVVPAALATLILVPVFLSTTTAKSALQKYVTVGMSADYESNVERLNRWIAAVRMLLDRPLTGVGPSAYETAYPHYRETAFATAVSDRQMGAHSEVLKIAAEQGVPGLLAFAFLVVTFFGTGIRLLREGATPEIRRLAGAICAGVFVYWIHMLFNEYWRVAKITFPLWIFIGLLGALAKIDRERRAAILNTDGGAPESAEPLPS